MYNPIRGAAFAVAAFALAVAAWGTPLQAYAMEAVPAPTTGQVSIFEHLADLAGFARPEVRTLGEQVAEQGGVETRSREEDCLASAVYFEARGESLEGQLAVAEVVMNRARSGRYPSSWCGVVAQRSQFSFVRGGVIPRADRGSEAWRRAVGVARIAQQGGVRMLSQNVLWYHANYVSPRWGRRLEREGRIGAHIFYR